MAPDSTEPKQAPPIPPPARPADGHKGTFGRVLLIAGSRRYPGAAILATRAALRAGSGLVSTAVPDGLYPSIALGAPSAIWLPLPTTPEGALARDGLDLLLEETHSCQCAAIGPGLSTHPETQALVVEYIQAAAVPLVIDADAINALAGKPSLLATRSASTLLTPHPGEHRRLTNLSIATDEKERVWQAELLARETRSTVILKGARTVITDGDQVRINETGNSGMGTGGSGDVLTGLLASLVAQGVAPFDAAAAAVWLHGLAGDIGASQLTERGLIADDLVTYLPTAQRVWEDSTCR